MPEITVTVPAGTTVAQVHAIIARLPRMVAAGGAKVEAAMKVVGNNILTNVVRAFHTKSAGGTDEAGERWASLSPLTVIRKRGRTDILKDKDELVESLTPNSGSSNQVFKINGATGAFGTRRKWAHIHHRGSLRIRQRRLWPTLKRWPRKWKMDVLRPIRDAAVELLVDALRRGY